MPLPIALALIVAAFFAGAFAFRRNPLLGARTLTELEDLYDEAKRRLVARIK